MYIGSNDRILCYPVPDGAASPESQTLTGEKMPTPLPEERFLPLTEEYSVCTVEDGFSSDVQILLSPSENYFHLGRFHYVSGNYVEEDGQLVLRGDEGEFRFRRQGDSLVYEGGSPLYMEGAMEQGLWGIAEELPVGTIFPLSAKGGLRSGTYRLEREGSSASLDFDLEAMTCTLVATDGMVYSGAISIDEGRIRLEIPTGAFFLLPAAADGIEVSNLLEAMTIAPELEDATLLFQYAG